MSTYFREFKVISRQWICHLFKNSMVVYTMGPVRSRPFTMAVHSVIGIGFLAGTFLVKPFLPEEHSSR